MRERTVSRDQHLVRVEVTSAGAVDELGVVQLSTSEPGLSPL
ncbi:hypothetical protein [Planosporangium mesophilum]|nr:hypothetical protein [Planosporangium mesophilum]